MSLECVGFADMVENPPVTDSPGGLVVKGSDGNRRNKQSFVVMLETPEQVVQVYLVEL
jgi:hypothetical protein